MYENKGLVMRQGLLRTQFSAFFVAGFDAKQLKNSFYSLLSKNLIDFKKLNSLALSLKKRISTFLTFNDFAQKLVEKKAMYHKNCLYR